MNLDEFKRQVLPFKNKLFRFSYRIVGTRPEAEDVVQEVFIKLWKTREELTKYRNLEAWAMTLTRNLSIDKIRSKHRKNNEIGESLHLASSNTTPYKMTEFSDTIKHIQNFINDLPEKQKMVIQLRDLQGYTYQEIADILSISMSQVKVNLFRARTTVKTKLKNQESYGA